MKKRILSVLMALSLTLGLLPGVALATGGTECAGGESCTSHVAAIGNTHYTSLADAVSAAQANNTVKLLSNTQLTQKLTIRKNITLNGNNKTITGQNNDATVFIEISSADVTVQNLTVKDFGGSIGTTSQWGLFKVTGTNPNLTAKNVTASNFNRAAFDFRAGTFELDGCVIDCENKSTSKLTKGVLAENAGGTIKNTTITNAATTYTTDETGKWNTNAVETWGNTTLTITGCTFGTTAAPVNNGISINTGDKTSSVTVSSTNIVANVRAAKLTPQKDKNYNNFTNENSVTGASALTIKSGSYTGGGNGADKNILLINQAGVGGKGCTISVEGGTFSSDPTNFVAKGYTVSESNGSYTVAALNASNSVASITNGETTTYYTSLAAAIDAAQANDTVKLLSNTQLTQKLTISKNITLDGNNKTITGQNNDATVFIEISSADVTVQNLTVKDFGGSIGTTSQWGLFKVTGTNPNLTAKNVTASNFNRAAFDFRAGTFELDDCVIDCENRSTSKLTKGVLAENANGTIKNTTITNAATTYTTDETGKWNTNAVETWGNTTLTITGCTFGTTAAPVNNGISVNTGNGKSTVTVSDTTIVAKVRAAKLTPQKDENYNNFTDEKSVTGTSTLTIKSGSYTGSLLINQAGVDGKGCSIAVKGGYFTDDPSSFLAENYRISTSDKNGFSYMVVEGNLPQDVVPSTGTPVVEAGADIPNDQKDAIVNALKNTEVNGLDAAAHVEAATVTNEQKAAGKAALKSANVSVADTTTVTIHAQTYLKITPTDYKDEDGKKTLYVDISAYSQLVAATTDDPSDLNFPGDTGTTNAVKLPGTEKKIENVGTVTIKIQLPDGFITAPAPDHIYVVHKGHEYEATVTSTTTGGDSSTTTYFATFVNPHGFSPFVLSTSSTAVAKIGSDSYTSLQDAVNNVTTGQTIELLAAGQSATVSKEITFTVKSTTDADGNSLNYSAIINAGSGYNMTTATAEGGGTTYTFTRVSGGGGGGSSSSATLYDVKVLSALNGNVSATPVKAKKDATIAVTASPDKGYVLDTVTAQDKDGNVIELTDKGDGKFTFSMPAKAVTVSATFKAETPAVPEQPEEPTHNCPASKFGDVDLSLWYHEAIDYALLNSIMKGTGDTTFAPNDDLNRAMMAQILYNLAGQPAGGSESFYDVNEGDWFYAAVAWAAENGIVNGITADTFGPMQSVTRQQMVTMLYRFCQSLGLDVSVGEDTNILSYDDAEQIDEYAVAAFQWAVGAGVISGMGDNTLAPNGTATRAQVAQMMTNFHQGFLAE